MKKIIICGCLAIILIATSGYFLHNYFQNESNTSSNTAAQYSIDSNNPYEVVGSVDYVFVAKVNKLLDTRQLEPGIVITTYEIDVIDNIKGKLKKNTDLKLTKFGGKIDGETFILENDVLPIVGKYYVFNAFTNANDWGEFEPYLSGANSNILIEGAIDKHDVVSSKEYNDYKKYVKNQIKSGNRNCKSMYDVDYDPDDECILN